MVQLVVAQTCRFVNIGPGDINSGNLKLILGLIWTIIYHYQIQASFKALKAAGGAGADKGGSAKNILLEVQLGFQQLLTGALVGQLEDWA